MNGKYHSRFLGWVTDEELRKLYDENACIEEDIREWLRYSDGEFVYEQMDELRECIVFETDAWDNVYARPRHGAAECGDLAYTVRHSIYSYPSTMEDDLAKLERYAEGVDRLGGSVWLIPDHFERVIDECMQRICDEYARCFKQEYSWWMDATKDDIFEYFMQEPDEYLERCDGVAEQYVYERDHVRERHNEAAGKSKRKAMGFMQPVDGKRSLKKKRAKAKRATKAKLRELRRAS